jgi:hypothetical protein
MEIHTGAAHDSKLEKKTVASFSSISEPNELKLAGFVPPTEEEMDTLRHVPDKINWRAYCKSLPLPEHTLVILR